MLSLVVDSLSSGSVADVLVVPVGISYDRIIEGNYNSEQLVSVPTSPSNLTWHYLGCRRKQGAASCRWVIEAHGCGCCSHQGKPKKNESLWGIACGVFRMLRKNYGCVRVDFNQPFSLKVAKCSLNV